MDQPQPQDAPQQIPQINSLASLRSFQSMNPEPEPEPKDKEQEQAQELQVVHSKVDKGINRQEIMRMFNQQLQKEEKQREQIEKRRMEMRKKKQQAPQKLTNKRSQLQEKKQHKQQALLQALNQKFTRLYKRTESVCKRYRTMFRPSIYDTKMNRYRFECKQKLFKHLCFALQQLKQMEVKDLSESERAQIEQDPYIVVKKFATIIDAAMVRTLNKGDRVDVSREYKNQWENLLNNTKDQHNLELKRKILSGNFQPGKIALANQIDFFTSAKREKILESQKQYVAQFTVEKAIVNQPAEDENYNLLERPKMEEEVPNVVEPPALKPEKSSFINNFISESSIAQIEQLLSQAQLSKMLKRLEQDIQGSSRQFLKNNFREVFEQ